MTIRRLTLLALVMGATIGCDRVTKVLAQSWLAGHPAQSFLADSVRLVYSENVGGFLSLGASLSPPLRTALFTGATGIVLLLLIVMLVRSRDALLYELALALFIAGGVSNWLDRLLRGSVVDFLNLGIGPLRTGIFNVADVAITAGVVLLVLAEWRARGPRRGVV